MYKPSEAAVLFRSWKDKPKKLDSKKPVPQCSLWYNEICVVYWEYWDTETGRGQRKQRTDVKGALKQWHEETVHFGKVILEASFTKRTVKDRIFSFRVVQKMHWKSVCDQNIYEIYVPVKLNTKSLKDALTFEKAVNLEKTL